MSHFKSPTKLWQALSLLLVFTLALAACAPAATPEPTPEPTAIPTPEPTAVPAVTTVIEDFEAAPTLSGAGASIGDVAYNGVGALKSSSATGEWHVVGLEFAAPQNFSQHQAVCFFVYDTTTHNDGKANNTVGVKLYDAAGASAERYSDNEGVGDNLKTKTNAWVPMCLNLVSFTGIDQTQVAKIEFTMYWAGDYYFDDLTLLAQGDKLTVKEQPESEAPLTSVIFQDFETEGDFFYEDYQAAVSRDTEVFHSGAASLKAFGESGEWHVFGAYPLTRPFDASGYSQVCFWINDTTTHNDGKADNTVGVKIFDVSGANQEFWTDNALVGTNPKTVTGEFVQMCLNLAPFSDIDLTQVDKIQFALYWAGTYYVDDIEFLAAGVIAPEPFLVQGFETEGDFFYEDYQAAVSRDTEVFHSGTASLKAFSESGEWHAFGAYPTPRPFDARRYSQVCFWINDTTTHNDGKADNTVGVKLFDVSGANQEFWTDNALVGTNPKTVTGEFVQMCLNLAAFSDIDLSQVDKIQFALYWAGTYYVDDIEFMP